MPAHTRTILLVCYVESIAVFNFTKFSLPSQNILNVPSFIYSLSISSASKSTLFRQCTLTCHLIAPMEKIAYFLIISKLNRALSYVMRNAVAKCRVYLILQNLNLKETCSSHRDPWLLLLYYIPISLFPERYLDFSSNWPHDERFVHKGFGPNLKLHLVYIFLSIRPRTGVHQWKL